MKLRLIVGIIVVLLLIIPQINALYTKVWPYGSTHVNQASNATNYGTTNLSYVQSYKNKNHYYMYVGFNITNETHFISVNASLWPTFSDSYSNVTMKVYLCNDSFNDLTITWLNRNTEVINCDWIVKNATLNTITAKSRFKINLTKYMNNAIFNKKFTLRFIIYPQNLTVVTWNSWTTRLTVANFRPYLEYSGGLGVTQIFPNASQHYNFYNGSIVLLADSLMNCTLNDTNWTLQNSQPDFELNYENSKTLSNRNYSISWNCIKIGSPATASGTVKIVIDRTYPTISIASPTNHTLTNKNFTLKINYYDIYLYRTNTTVRRLSDGIVVYGRDYTAPSGTMRWDNVSKAIIITNGSYSDGSYSVYGVAADTHTAEEFNKEAVITTTTQENKEIMTDLAPQIIQTEKGEIIEKPSVESFERVSEEKTLTMKFEDATFKITYPSEMEIEPIKLTDRFVFDHSSKQIYGKTYEIIEAEKIISLPYSPYLGHLIINDKFWFDAIGLSNARVEKIEENKYAVLWDKWEDSVLSQSLGGLNENNKTSYFNIDKTKPTLLKNITLSYGSGAKIWLNTSENVSYNATITETTCTGTKRKYISDTSFSDYHYLRIIGLNVSKLYYARVQIHDAANNNRTYCLNFTTEPYAFYISNYSYHRSSSTLSFNASAVNSFDRPFVYNFSVFRNGIKIENGIRNYINITGYQYHYKYNAGAGMIYKNMSVAPYTDCIDGNTLNIKWHITNTANQSISGKCYDGTQWISIVYDSPDFRLYDEYLQTFFDNGTSVNSEVQNYSSSGNWVNLSTIFDGNANTFGYCASGSDDCYLSLTYRLTNARLWYSDFFYSIINITNVSSGRYFIVINTWDGYTRSTTLNITYNITFYTQIYNEMTGKIIDNVTSNITFISDDPMFLETLTFTTTNGLVNIEGLAYVDYSIIYEATGYEKRHYYMNKDELQLNGTLVLLLLDQNIGDFAIIQVVDQDLNPIEGALVKVLKNVPNFDDKQVISVLRQNFEGESTLDFKLYTDNYQFLVYLDGVLIKTSEETQVSKQVVKIQVPISETKFLSMRYYTDAFADVTIANGTTSDKRCTFVFAGDNLNYGCLRVSRRNMAQNDVQICNSCVYGHSGIATCDFNITENNIYFCQGFIDTNTTASEYLGDQETVSLNAGRNVYYTLGLFISFLLTLGMAFAFREHPSMQIFALALGLIFSVMMGFVAIPYGGLMLILLVAAFFMFKGESL